MTANEIAVMNHVQKVWTVVQAQMTALYSGAESRPNALNDIFRFLEPGSADEVLLEVGPVVFKLPEKAHHTSAALFVVIQGTISFTGPDFRTLPLKSKSFGTEVGYFRHERGALEHVFGAHYDFDVERPGHPVFHAQFKPVEAFSEDVRNHFRMKGEDTSSISGILSNVRLPTAQMDAFSAILQILSDHLVSVKSTNNALGNFKKLLQTGGFIQGTAQHLAFLNSPLPSHCYRSHHWYGQMLA